MNDFKFGLYNLRKPKDEEIPEIAKYIIDKSLYVIPSKLRSSLPLLNELVEMGYNNVFSLHFDEELYKTLNVDTVIDFVNDHAMFFSPYTLPKCYVDDPRFWTRVLERGDDFNVFRASDLFSYNRDVYEKIDKNLIVNALKQTTFYDYFTFIHDDDKLLKEIIDSNIPFDLSAFNKDTINAINYDNIVDYYTNCDPIGKIPSEIVHNRDLLTKLCDSAASKNPNILYKIYNFGNLSDEEKLFLCTRYDVSFDLSMTDQLVDYIIDNNVTNLPKNTLNEVLPGLISKRYPLIFEAIGDKYISPFYYDSATKEALCDIFFETKQDNVVNYSIIDIVFSNPKSLEHIQEIGDYIINNNQVVHFTWPCNRSPELANYLCQKNYKRLFDMNFDFGTLQQLSPSLIADYIINNNIVNLPSLKNVFETLPILIDRKYSHLFEINTFIDGSYGTDYVLDDSEKEKLVDLYFESDYKGSLGLFFEGFVFNSPKSLEHIDKIGDYIIDHKYMAFVNSYPCRNSVELFNYLYDRDFPLLFSLNFNSQVYNSMSIDKLKEYYKKYPNAPFDKLNINLKLALCDVDMSKIDYRVIKPLVLYDARIEASKKMKMYEDLSPRITAYLQENTPKLTFHQFYNQLFNVMLTMNMTDNDILALFTNYKNNPAVYETEIINLFRKFGSKKKETLAQDMYNDHMKRIFEDYTKLNMDEVYKYVAIQRRKEVFLHDIDFILNKEKIGTKLINTINELGLGGLCKSNYELVSKIIMGEDVITKPDSYSKLERQRLLVRLNNGYYNPLMGIINNNMDYKSQIISYIKGEFEYDELRKLLDSKDLRVLYDIRNLFTEANATLTDDFHFNADITITPEEVNINRAYERNIQAINKLRKHLNKAMNEMYPLDTIDVTPQDVIKYSSNALPKACFDPNKFGDLILTPMFRTLKLRNSFMNSECNEAFEQLFIDTGIVYGLPFVNIGLSNDIEGLCKNFDKVFANVPTDKLTFENLDMLIKKSKVLEFITPYREAILGEDVIYDLVTNNSFIYDNTSNSKNMRVNDAAKYIALAGRNVKSTVPYTKVNTSGITAERYRSDDPEILLAGIKTDACFRLYGNDNDFLLYTMFNKNGLVVKFTDDEGKFLGRMSGFRNGNTVYFNQLRTIYDQSGFPTKNTAQRVKGLCDAAKAYAEDLISQTKDSEDPIKHVLITQSYGLADNTDLPLVNKPTNWPMNVDSPDFDDFKLDIDLNLLETNRRGFTTDYNSSLPILLLATEDISTFRNKNVLEYDAKALYDSPRDEPYIYDGGDNKEKVIAAINKINAKSIYWGDYAKRGEKMLAFQNIKDIDNVKYAVIGDDFYIVIDNDGKKTEMCLPYDDRALEEFKKYQNIIADTLENDDTHKR